MECLKCGCEMINDWDLNLRTGEIEDDRWRCKCGHEEKVSKGVSPKMMKKLDKLVKEQRVRAFDPDEAPDWETPTEEEMKKYLEALRRMEVPRVH